MAGGKKRATLKVQPERGEQSRTIFNSLMFLIFC